MTTRTTIASVALLFALGTAAVSAAPIRPVPTGSGQTPAGQNGARQTPAAQTGTEAR